MKWGMTITKVAEEDDGSVIVEGVATDETPDEDGEIVDYEASKAAFSEWSEWGNVREMHQLSAVGTALKWWADDKTRTIGVRARIVDPVAARKVREGVYKGFSIGGRKLERRLDGGRWRITKYRMIELSLVDRPANPSAKVTIAKAADVDDAGDEEGLEKAAEGEREELRRKARERSRKYGIAVKEDGHLTPPKGYPEDPDQYGDPVNYKYPIDEKHIRPAVSYFNQGGQREAGGYTPEEWAIIGRRIARAATRLLGAKYEYRDGRVERVDEDAKKAAGAEDTPEDEPQGDAVLKAAEGSEGSAAAGSDGDGGAEATEDGSGEGAGMQKATGPAVGEPGSAEWEQVDAGLLAQAVEGLRAVIEVLKRVRDRERAEMAFGHDRGIDELWQVIQALTESLKITAGLAVMESAEAAAAEGLEEGAEGGDLQKVGRRLSKASLERLHGSMRSLASLCGCEACGAFLQAIGGEGVAKAARAGEEGSTMEEEQVKDGAVPGDGGEDEKMDKAAAPEDAGAKDNGAATEPASGEEGASEGQQASAPEMMGEALQKAIATSLEESLRKALEGMGLAKLGGAAEDLLKAAEAAKRLPELEERIKRLEEQPMPGGPMLRGMATAQDYYLVRKGAVAEEIGGPDNAVSILERLADQASDPLVRDALSREIAKLTYLQQRAGGQ